jgi:hypothetical protein
VSRFSGWLIDLVSRALEPNEREAVRGDLVESGESAGRALLGMFGLVVRRQSALWKTLPPWFALTLVLPMAVLLSTVARRMADGSAIYLWLYFDNGDWSYLANAAYRHDLILYALQFAIQHLRLFGWSWCGGFMLGLISRRSLPSQSFLFAVFALTAGLLAAPLVHFAPWVFSSARDREVHKAIFSLTFYRSVLPIIFQAALVVGPSLWGMCRGARYSPARARAQAALWFAGFAMLSAMAFRTAITPVPPGSAGAVAALIVYSPLAFLGIVAIARRWRAKVIAT